MPRLVRSSGVLICAAAAAVCVDGRVVGRYHKRRLPNYAVFDEQRYFAPGEEPLETFDQRVP